MQQLANITAAVSEPQHTLKHGTLNAFFGEQWNGVFYLPLEAKQIITGYQVITGSYYNKLPFLE